MRTVLGKEDIEVYKKQKVNVDHFFLQPGRAVLEMH